MGSTAHRRSGLVHARLIAPGAGGVPARSTTQLRRSTTLPACSGRAYLATMSVKDEIAHYTIRVAELERELDAAPRLSLAKVIAGELMRTRAALEAAKAKSLPAGRRGKPERRARRTSSSAADRASC